MKLPVSWLKDFVEIDLNDLFDLARMLTMAGLEVEEIQLAGLSVPETTRREFKVHGLAWDRDKIFVAQINEVMPHPNAERLVLCRVFDGAQEHIVLTGAPSLLAYKNQGPLPKPFKVAYALQGARIYDGHAPGWSLVTLKPARIRGVDSSSMVCSEKELGISEEHEDIIYFDDDAPVGTPLVDYIGDAVFEVKINPNMIRNACVLGIAREIAAITGKPLRAPRSSLEGVIGKAEGAAYAGIQILNPELNPRFVLGLVRGVQPQPSPYWVQRRLRLAGMRPINSVVDATNYAMLEIGEPLHAFDYDILVQRAGGKPPTIITRTAAPGEKLTTLDGVEHTLDDFTVLVCDTAGALSIAGVMGGLESEVSENTRNVLLEGASWNFINIRKTTASQHMNTEASYRFSRGIHPELAMTGVKQCLDYIAQWSGGNIEPELVDAYPLPYKDAVVRITAGEVNRRLGLNLTTTRIATLLDRLDFEVEVEGEFITAKSPAYRTDISEGVIGQADLLEEIARLYGYDNIPASRLADALPVQRRRPLYEGQERMRDCLAALGLMEVISLRLTSPENERRLLPRRNQSLSEEGQENLDADWISVRNPIAQERSVLRRSLLASVMEALEVNSRKSGARASNERLAFFEIGSVYLRRQESADQGQLPLNEDDLLPIEQPKVAIVLQGKREKTGWKTAQAETLDFYDLKGIIEELLDMHALKGSFEPAAHPSFHPGKCARLWIEGGDGSPVDAGIFGELHPQVKENYDLAVEPVLAAELDLQPFLKSNISLRSIESVPVYPPVLEDIAVIVDEAIPAVQVESVIRKAGGKTLAKVSLFDVYRGAQIGEGKKSLAYNLVFQVQDHTLTDDEAEKVRWKIIRLLEQELKASLRGA